MNHNVTIGIVAIVAAMALTGVAFAIPQQALAGGHHYKHNNHNSNSIKVDQQVNQLNNCTSPLPPPQPRAELTAGIPGSTSSTVCLNFGDNSADIHK
jgi:hypothetical protein